MKIRLLGLTLITLGVLGACAVSAGGPVELTKPSPSGSIAPTAVKDGLFWFRLVGSKCEQDVCVVELETENDTARARLARHLQVINVKNGAYPEILDYDQEQPGLYEERQALTKVVGKFYFRVPAGQTPTSIAVHGAPGTRGIKIGLEQ